MVFFDGGNWIQTYNINKEKKISENGFFEWGEWDTALQYWPLWGGGTLNFQVLYIDKKQLKNIL